MHLFILLNVTHLSEYNDIIAKLIQFYNSNAKSKRFHPVSEVGVKNFYKNMGFKASCRNEGHAT